MILKLMSNEDLPDDDERKGYTLIDGVTEVRFDRSEDGGSPFIEYIERSGAREHRALEGNAYVMNDLGHEIEVFGVSSPYEAGEMDEPWPNVGDLMDQPWPCPYDPIRGGFTNLCHEPQQGAEAEINLADGLLQYLLAGGELPGDPPYFVLKSEDEVDGGREERRKLIESYIHQIRTLENDRPFLAELLGDKTTDAHMESLVSAATFCAVAARTHRDPVSGQGIEPDLKPTIVKVTGQPNHVGAARLFELREALDIYLKKGTSETRFDLAISAMRLYVWKDYVRSTDNMGDKAMENLCNVAEAILTA